MKPVLFSRRAALKSRPGNLTFALASLSQIAKADGVPAGAEGQDPPNLFAGGATRTFRWTAFARMRRRSD